LTDTLKPVDTRLDILTKYFNKAEWIVPTHIVAICRDRKDNQFLELALSGKADCIVTNDEDLLVLNPFENIPIITPKEFLSLY
jgi:uncharacterized protein